MLMVPQALLRLRLLTPPWVVVTGVGNSEQTEEVVVQEAALLPRRLVILVVRELQAKVTPVVLILHQLLTHLEVAAALGVQVEMLVDQHLAAAVLV